MNGHIHVETVMCSIVVLQKTYPFILLIHIGNQDILLTIFIDFILEQFNCKSLRLICLYVCLFFRANSYPTVAVKHEENFDVRNSLPRFHLEQA